LKTDWNKTRAAMIAARVFSSNIQHLTFFFLKKLNFYFFISKKVFIFTADCLMQSKIFFGLALCCNLK
jgi:hypothetical protein